MSHTTPRVLFSKTQAICSIVEWGCLLVSLSLQRTVVQLTWNVDLNSAWFCKTSLLGTFPVVIGTLPKLIFATSGICYCKTKEVIQFDPGSMVRLPLGSGGFLSTITLYLLFPCSSPLVWSFPVV